MLLVLLAGAIATAGALGGPYLGSRATVATQQDGVREARQAEARAKRALAYSSFLGAADRAVAPANRVANLCDRVYGFRCAPAKARSIYGTASDRMLKAAY